MVADPIIPLSIIHYLTPLSLQTVTKENNLLYFNLLNRFKDRTGVPVILNTSFNGSAEPIVGSPSDAMKTFSASKIDFLIMGNYLVSH
ncbi:MAG: hypothetical protein A3G04_03975 [Candidatus Taylorbacteria bacterium RIFCSPLOWO2_12_FULL_44_9]|nr:MAG: hypothetical protein A3G04_03975 [Candidatus Taylorbacteria bacterium RIFCSPLOWO2_12_FULL_44_9]